MPWGFIAFVLFLTAVLLPWTVLWELITTN